MGVALSPRVQIAESVESDGEVGRQPSIPGGDSRELFANIVSKGLCPSLPAVIAQKSNGLTKTLWLDIVARDGWRGATEDGGIDTVRSGRRGRTANLHAHVALPRTMGHATAGMMHILVPVMER